MRTEIDGADVVFWPDAGEKWKEHRITIPQNVREAIAAYTAMRKSGLTDAQVLVVIEILKLMKG